MRVHEARYAVLAIAAVAYRELLSLFVSPLGYVVGTLFLLQQGWNFALLLRVLNDPLAAPGPVLQFYFGGSFFIFWLPVVFVCAAISMRLLAEERKLGTLEALLTAPLGPRALVLGKFVGALAFYVLLWLPTAVFYVLLRGAAVQPDVGPIAAGYLGTVLVGASFLAIGVVASALSQSQLAAAISTFVVCTILVLAGLLTDQVESPALAHLLERTSLLTMMQELAQGIVDARFLWVHGAVCVLALELATVLVDPRRRPEAWLRTILVAIAVVHVGWWGIRHAPRADWTGGRIYSLSDRAREVLRSLDRPVDVRVVVPSTLGAGRPNPLAQELREVLTRMQGVTPALRVRTIDPDRDRQDAEAWLGEHGLGGRDLADGVVLVQAGTAAELRRTHVLPGELVTWATGADVQITGPRVQEFRGEEALLSAFVRVTRPLEITLCATQGHGEPGLDDLQPFGGYAHVERLFASAGIVVQAITLDEREALSGCDVVMVGGPSGRLPPAHVAALERYADAGGDLLLLAGAVITPEARGLAHHGLEPLTQRYGIQFGERVVLDPHTMPGATPLLAFTLVDGWGEHAIVRSLVGRPVSFVFVRELELRPNAQGESPALLVQAGESAWAEADIEAIRSGGSVGVDPRDRAGPIPIAAAAERGGSRLVVIASDQFALNAYLREDVVYDHGRELLQNAVGWLSGREVLLGIRPRAREHVKLVLLPEQLRRMTLVSVLGLPGFAAMLGLFVLRRRRR